MKKLFRPYLSIFLLGSFLAMATSCGGDEPEPEDPAEEIESARLVLEPEGKGALVTINYGPNSQNPSATLKSNTTYKGTLSVFDAKGVDITNEIKLEADKHEVFYQAAGAGITVTTLDKDKNGRPLGLETTLQTTAPGTGTLRVLLKHQPTKGATSDPNKGETDLNMPINVTVIQ
jgi:hypothetical protein